MFTAHTLNILLHMRTGNWIESNTKVDRIAIDPVMWACKLSTKLSSLDNKFSIEIQRTGNFIKSPDGIMGSFFFKNYWLWMLVKSSFFDMVKWKKISELFYAQVFHSICVIYFVTVRAVFHLLMRVSWLHMCHTSTADIRIMYGDRMKKRGAPVNIFFVYALHILMVILFLESSSIEWWKIENHIENNNRPKETN